MTAIVILGASVWVEGPSPTLLRRTLHGASLYKAGRANVIVPCGGEGDNPPSEAEAMREVLRDNGISDDAIHPEPYSTNTYENLRNAQVILSKLKISKAIIVTDGYHAPRAIMVARALGMDATVDCPTPPATPQALRLRRLRHEALAIAGYRLRLSRWIKRDRRDQMWLRKIS